MLCPVCKTECGTENVCKECGFDQIQVEFLNREEAIHWMENTVIPFREKWQEKQTNSEIDWKELLFQQKDVRYFFEVTVPAATVKNDVIRHIVLICPYPRVREQFIKLLQDNIPYRNIITTPDNKKLTMGDFAAFLSNHSENDLLILNPQNIPTEKRYSECIRAAFEDFILLVQIGKGPGAREVRMDIPKFTWMVIADKMKDIPIQYHSLFCNHIEIKFDDHQICKLEIQAVATELKLKLLASAVEVIAKEVKNDIDKATSCVKHIKDFLFVKGMADKTVSADLAKDIMSQFI
ncbi:MAG: hypothetical protein IJO74_00520 [Clostridia bacterium]|nr:hypothetical protein [Clostridia bacterium]